MDIKHILKDHAYQNIPLNFDESYALGYSLIEGCRGDPLAQIQSITAMSALHTQATYRYRYSAGKAKYHGHYLPKTAAEQIAGICAAIFEYDIARSEFQFLEPAIPYAMDNCGMGGDLVVTANVSTLAALIAAAGNVAICKHGSPANADGGRHGSSDFIQLLGINTYADKSKVVKCVEQESFGYTEALDTRYKLIHEQTHKFAQLPHMNDIIGPITNPLHPGLLKKRVLGVNHLISPFIVADAYRILNERGLTRLEHGLFVRGLVDKRGKRGMDEASICSGGTEVAELINGEIRNYHLGAPDFGLKPVRTRSISPPPGKSKGDFSLRILNGETKGPPLDMVLANAALLFYLAGHSKKPGKCFQFAREIHQSGAVQEKIKRIQRILS